MTEGTAIEPSSYVILDPQLNQIFVDTVDSTRPADRMWC